VLLVEDVHTSYFKDFGNPSTYSFVNFAKRVADAINSRFPAVKVVRTITGKKYFSVTFYESIVVFAIDSRRCFASSSTAITASRSMRGFQAQGHGAERGGKNTLYIGGKAAVPWPHSFVTAAAKQFFVGIHWLLSRRQTNQAKSFFD